MLLAESLHSDQGTPLQRAEWTSEYMRWATRKNDKTVLGQVDPKPLGGRPPGGTRAAARKLGIEIKEAQRAVKIAALTPEAKQAAIETGAARGG